MANSSKISDCEAEVMKVLWERAPRTLPEIVNEVKSGHDEWEGVTIKTMLTRLIKKGAAKLEGTRRCYRYFPVVTREEYLEEQSDDFLARGFGGEPAAMLSFFVKRGKITRDELKILEKEISELEK